jgi:hypothetical protein
MVAERIAERIVNGHHYDSREGIPWADYYALLKLIDENGRSIFFSEEREFFMKDQLKKMEQLIDNTMELWNRKEDD